MLDRFYKQLIRVVSSDRRPAAGFGRNLSMPSALGRELRSQRRSQPCRSVAVTSDPVAVPG
eukprot:7963028-Alexandrium_andersonii.AAC.1